VTCPGALILHADGTIAGCTLDDDEGDPVRCYVWTLAGCNYCGVH
jgi:hypothetical protein